MSEFGVFVEEIERVYEHGNADALEMASLVGKGFQFVVGKDNFKPGDKVFYFPVDALIPPGLDEKLGVQGKLAGSAKNRVKTIKLRGQISQGIVAPLSIYDGVPVEGEDYAGIFGVEKYEVPITFSTSGNMLQMPEYIRSKYDIESAQRFLHVLEYIEQNNIELAITEKLEGTQLNIALDEEYHVCSRNNKWERVIGKNNKPCENLYLDIFERNPQTADFLKWGKEKLGVENLALRSEIVGPGIQKNIYKLKEIDFYAFEVVANGKHLPYEEFNDLLLSFNCRYTDKKSEIKIAPLLWMTSWNDDGLQGFLKGKSIVEAAYGISQLGPNLREGIVLRPVKKELWDSKLGRIILKVRDPIYLEKHGM